LYKPWPVLSHFVPRDEIADAWSEKQNDKSNTVAYGTDGPSDYTVEAYTDAELANGNPLAALVQKKSFIEPTTVELYKPWPVQSHFVSHEKGADAWSDKQHDKSNEVAYGADGPADYLVEPAVIPESLVQRTRHGIYKVKDSHSYISPYTHSDHAWSHDSHDASDETKWVENTKTLHADYVDQLHPNAEHHLKDGRTGVPSLSQ